MTLPPRTDDRDRIERLRDRFDTLGYTAAGIRAALGTTEEILSRARDIPVHVRRLRGAGPLGAVVRLFILDLPVPRRELAVALKFTLTDVLVSSYQVGGSNSSEALPVDQLSMSFGQIRFEYRPQNPDGSLGAAVIGGWDLRRNVKS